MAKKALILISSGFEDVEAVAPIDVLNRVGIEVTLASVEPGPVLGAYGTKLLADTTVAEVDASQYDAVICPGGKKNAESLAGNPAVVGIVREFMTQGKIVAAICAAPSHVLGEAAGLLKGRRCTGDPGFNDKLAACGALLTHEPVTVEGNLITGTGPGAALQFALTVASRLAGYDAAAPFAQKWNIRLCASLR